MPAALAALMRGVAGEEGIGGAGVLVVAALAFPPCLAAGFVAPLAVRAAVLVPNLPLSRTVGAIYAASAAGSVLGTVLAGFVLLEHVGASGLAAIVAALWLGLGALALPWQALSRPRRMAGPAALAGAIVAAVMLATPGPCLRESRYTCIRFADQALAGGGLLRFMVLDEGVHSASERDRPERLHLGYAALADRLARAAFAQSAAPRALVIGGGGATLPRAWSAPGQARVTSIELDPLVVQMAEEHMWAGNQPGLDTLVGDGRAIMRTMPADGRYDVVLMDAYRTRSVPPHLVTREFDALVASRMSARGVFLSNVIDRPDAPRLALSIARTLAEVFPVVDLWAVEDSAGGHTNFIVAAWKDAASARRLPQEAVTTSVMEAGQAVRTRELVWRRVDFKDADGHWPLACGMVLTDDRAPVDRLLAGTPMC
jgi:spermidine synthase